MRAIKDLKRKIRQKEEEIQGLKESVLRANKELDKAESYLEGLQESLRMIEKDSDAASGDTIRPGSIIDRARKALRDAGKPLYVDDLLRKMEKEV